MRVRPCFFFFGGSDETETPGERKVVCSRTRNKCRFEGRSGERVSERRRLTRAGEVCVIDRLLNVHQRTERTIVRVIQGNKSSSGSGSKNQQQRNTAGATEKEGDDKVTKRKARIDESTKKKRKKKLTLAHEQPAPEALVLVHPAFSSVATQTTTRSPVLPPQ